MVQYILEVTMDQGSYCVNLWNKLLDYYLEEGLLCCSWLVGQIQILKIDLWLNSSGTSYSRWIMIHLGTSFEKKRRWNGTHSYKSWLLVNKVNHWRLTFCWPSHINLFIISFIWMLVFQLDMWSLWSKHSKGFQIQIWII